MARIRYAVSCNHVVTVVFDGGAKYNLRVPGYEGHAHAISDAINRGCSVRSTGLDAGDDWARARARAHARQAAELAMFDGNLHRAYYLGRRPPATTDETVFDRIIRWVAGR